MSWSNRKPWLISMHRPSFVFVCILSSLFVAGPANIRLSFAQTASTNGSPAITLDQAIEAAKAHYPAIKAAQAQQQAAQGAIGVAKTAYLPRTDLLWQTNRATANNITVYCSRRG